jgi:CheY-like chemotaxis protein
VLLQGVKPDAIFMDLAMPGIDGWETIRRLRREGLSDAPVAIVSANAFDKGLDNDAGIAPEDFIVKPVRVSELLDWLGRRLALQWLDAPSPALPQPPDASAPPPDEAELRTLLELTELGYQRGILRQLDRIALDAPHFVGFIEPLRELAQGFQLDELKRRLREALREPVPGPQEGMVPGPHEGGAPGHQDRVAPGVQP